MALEILGLPIINDQRMVIDVDKIGIKTSSPTVELHVVGDGFFTGSLTVPTIVGTITTATNVIGGIASVSNLTVTSSADVSSISGTTLTYSTGRFTSLNGNIGIVTNLSGTNLSYLGIGTIGNLNVNNDLNVDGKIGIGTTNPTSKLFVVGDGKFTGIVTAQSFDATNIVGVPNITSPTNLNLNATTVSISTNLSIGGQVVSDLNVAGNGIFSGVVTATTFNGTLNGNASTATYATTAGIATNAQGLTGTPNITVGSITASSASFSGNVSIAGTLTYEDVSNVDSLGIVTARSGIEVGPLASIGATISSNGNSVFAGVVTATAFYGPNGLINSFNGIAISDNYVPVGAGFTTINFVGTGVSVSSSSSVANILIDPYINLDGGVPNSVYGGITSINGGGV